MGLISKIIATRSKNPVPPAMNIVMDWCLYHADYPENVTGFEGRVSSHDYGHITFIYHPNNFPCNNIYQSIIRIPWKIKIK